MKLRGVEKGTSRPTAEQLGGVFSQKGGSADNQDKTAVLLFGAVKVDGIREDYSKTARGETSAFLSDSYHYTAAFYEK